MYWPNVVIPISCDVVSCGLFTQHIFIFVTVKIALLMPCLPLYKFDNISWVPRPANVLNAFLWGKATKDFYSDLCEYPQKQGCKGGWPDNHTVCLEGQKS